MSKIERIGDESNFLRRRYTLEVDGLWIQPGKYTQQMVKAYEEQIGLVKLQQLPADNSIQLEDESEVLQDQDKTSVFRNMVGSGIYLCQERRDVAFTVKELASRMLNPTAMPFHHLKKFLGYLTKAIHKQEKVMSRKEKAIGAWRHSQIQPGVETKATESQHQEDSMH